jgi:predicted Holliday junction resolvase-like endonuclease
MGNELPGMTLKAIGIVILIYIIYIIVNSILAMRRHRRISVIYDKVQEIDQKLDLVLEKQDLLEKLHVKEPEEIKEKKSFWDFLFGKKEKSVKQERQEKEKECLLAKQPYAFASAMNWS